MKRPFFPVSMVLAVTYSVNIVLTTMKLLKTCKMVTTLYQR